MLQGQQANSDLYSYTTGYTVKAQCVSGRGYVDASERGYVDASERGVVKLELICQNDDYKRWFAGE